MTVPMDDEEPNEDCSQLTHTGDAEALAAEETGETNDLSTREDADMVSGMRDRVVDAVDARRRSRWSKAATDQRND